MNIINWMSILVRTIHCSHSAPKKIKKTCLLHQWNGGAANLREKMAFTPNWVIFFWLRIYPLLTSERQPQWPKTHTEGYNKKGVVVQMLCQDCSQHNLNGQDRCDVKIGHRVALHPLHPILRILTGITGFFEMWKWIDSIHQCDRM